jgi:phosphoglycolate phosphatase
MYQTVIFDFDGTIADSEHAMISSLNAISGEFGFSRIEPGEVASLRKLSIWQLVTKRLRIPFWNVLAILRLEKRAKAAFLARGDFLDVFPGMADGIARLREKGCLVGIVSSTPLPVIERVLRGSGIVVDFVSAGSPVYRKASAIRKEIRSRGVDKKTAVYVGDELRDINAAKHAGISVISVGWGLNDPAVLAARGARVASTPGELFSIITARV